MFHLKCYWSSCDCRQISSPSTYIFTYGVGLGGEFSVRTFYVSSVIIGVMREACRCLFATFVVADS